MKAVTNLFYDRIPEWCRNEKLKIELWLAVLEIEVLKSSIRSRTEKDHKVLWPYLGDYVIKQLQWLTLFCRKFSATIGCLKRFIQVFYLTSHSLWESVDFLRQSIPFFPSSLLPHLITIPVSFWTISQNKLYNSIQNRGLDIWRCIQKFPDWVITK